MKFIEGESYQITATDSYEEHVEPFTPTSNNIFVDFSIENDPTNAVIANDEEFETAFSNPEVNTFILAFDIELEANIRITFNKDIIIDGQNKYKFTGPGSITLKPHGNDRNLTFKNLTFEPADDITKWFKESDSNPPRYNYIISQSYESNVVDITFDNITVDTKDEQEVPGTFYLCTSSGDLTVKDSDINVENHQGFDMNRGGIGTIENNDFNKTDTPLNVNNHYLTELTIKNNNFENLKWVLHLSTHATDNKITVNNNELTPIDGSTSTQDSFENEALKIHESLGENNIIGKDYLTTYYDDKIGKMLHYEGDSTSPVYPN